MERTAAWIALLVFGAFSAWVVWEVGYLAIWLHLFEGAAGWQVAFDIVLFGLLAMGWMAHDAGRQGRTVWPYLVLTLVGDSVGPLLYLALAPGRRTTPGVARAA